jgi:hypothetical protein
MYYVIFEAAQESGDLDRIQRIKQSLVEQGLIGEMATPQPGRDIASLIENGLQKRYGTMILVGGSALINEASRILVHYDVVVGFVPLREEPELLQVIGAKNTTEAIGLLKRRRWHPHAVGLMENGDVFVTDLVLHTDHPTPITITTPDFTATEQRANQITIAPQSNTLAVTISTEQKNEKLSWWKKSKQKTAPTNSIFSVTTCVIESSETITGTVAGEVFATTPISCTVTTQSLRLIAQRKSLTPDQELGTVSADLLTSKTLL